MALGYISGLPKPVGGNACQREFAPNAGAFFQNTVPFFCLGNDEGEVRVFIYGRGACYSKPAVCSHAFALACAQSCMVQISQALAASGAIWWWDSESARPVHSEAVHVMRRTAFPCVGSPRGRVAAAPARLHFNTPSI